MANLFKHKNLNFGVILLMLKPKVFSLMYHLKYILGVKTIYQKTSFIAIALQMERKKKTLYLEFVSFL